MNIFLEDYTKKYVVVYGEGTRALRVKFRNLGGNWNPKLKRHPHKGWIFSKTTVPKLKALIGEETH